MSTVDNLRTTDLTWVGLELLPDLRGDSPATIRFLNIYVHAKAQGSYQVWGFSLPGL